MSFVFLFVIPVLKMFFLSAEYKVKLRRNSITEAVFYFLIINFGVVEAIGLAGVDPCGWIEVL